MKKIGILAVLSFAFALCLALAGCGSGGDAAKEAFVGTWDLAGMTQDGKETSSTDIGMLSSLGLEVTLNLNEDGTSELVLFGESMTGSWEAKSATEATMTVDGDAVPMTISDGKLMMEEGGNSLTFQKAEAASAEAASGDSAAADEAEEASGEASEKA